MHQLLVPANVVARDVVALPLVARAARVDVFLSPNVDDGFADALVQLVSGSIDAAVKAGTIKIQG